MVLQLLAITITWYCNYLQLQLHGNVINYNYNYLCNPTSRYRVQLYQG